MGRPSRIDCGWEEDARGSQATSWWSPTATCGCSTVVAGMPGGIAQPPRADDLTGGQAQSDELVVTEEAPRDDLGGRGVRGPAHADRDGLRSHDHVAGAADAAR